MTRIERQALESFAKSLNIDVSWKSASRASGGKIVISGNNETGSEHTFQDFWEAMHYLVLAPDGGPGLRKQLQRPATDVG